MAGERHLYDNDGIGSRFTSVTPFVPRLSAYPAWFMVEARTGWGRYLAIVTRSGRRQPWRLEDATPLDQQLPPSPAPDGAGYVQPGRFHRNLSADLATYFNAAVNHQKTRFVLKGPLTTAIVHQDLKAISQVHSNGWTVRDSFSTRPFSFTQGIRLRSGTVLGLTAIGRQWKVSSSNGWCFLEQPTQETGYLWSTVGGSGFVRQVNSNGVTLYAVLESRAGDKVIGALGEDTTAGLTKCSAG